MLRPIRLRIYVYAHLNVRCIFSFLGKKKKKVCLRFADRPCFIAADPTIFSQKIKKTRQFSGPASAVPDFSTGIQNFH